MGQKPRNTLSSDWFWSVVDGVRRVGDEPELVLRRRLERMATREIVLFNGILEQKVAAAYGWDLWAACYLVQSGLCSDDVFFYFRFGLVARGRAIYEAAIADPDTLADVGEIECDETYSSCIDAVYAARTGGAEVPVSTQWPAKPYGQKFDFSDDEQLARKLPRLWKRYRARLLPNLPDEKGRVTIVVGGEEDRALRVELRDVLTRMGGTTRELWKSGGEEVVMGAAVVEVRVQSGIGLLVTGPSAVVESIQNQLRRSQ
jgi:hypothetical protein